MSARLWRLLAVMIAVVVAWPVAAEELVLALSTREVAITSTYTGAEITVFVEIGDREG